MSEMIRGAVRFGPATGARYDPAQIAILEARLRLAEEVCEALAAYRDSRSLEQLVATADNLNSALARWREAKR
jgi:hypothetical protein